MLMMTTMSMIFLLRSEQVYLWAVDGNARWPLSLFLRLRLGCGLFVGCVINSSLFTLYQDLNNFGSPSFCHIVDPLCSKTAI